MTDPITKEDRAKFIEYARVIHSNPRMTPVGVEMFNKALAYETALQAAEARIAKLEGALDERGLFSNPAFMVEIADEIDCGASCENIWWESDTNASGCHLSEKGDYCPNDLAETLRAVAKVARAALGEKP